MPTRYLWELTDGHSMIRDHMPATLIQVCQVCLEQCEVWQVFRLVPVSLGS